MKRIPGIDGEGGSTGYNCAGSESGVNEIQGAHKESDRSGLCGAAVPIVYSC